MTSANFPHLLQLAAAAGRAGQGQAAGGADGGVHLRARRGFREQRRRIVCREQTRRLLQQSRCREGQLCAQQRCTQGS